MVNGYREKDLKKNKKKQLKLFNRLNNLRAIIKR